MTGFLKKLAYWAFSIAYWAFSAMDWASPRRLFEETIRRRLFEGDYPKETIRRRLSEETIRRRLFKGVAHTIIFGVAHTIFFD